MENVLLGLSTHLVGHILTTGAGYAWGKYNFGKRKIIHPHLFEYPEYFPFEISDNTSLLYKFSKEKSINAMKYFSQKQNKNRTAIGELIYLSEKYEIEYYLNIEELKIYKDFKVQFKEEVYSKYVFENLLHNYVPFLNALGIQFEGMQTEFVLHNLIDPKKSVIHIVNSITGRNVGDPLTNLGFEIMMNYKKDINNPSALCGYEVRDNNVIFKSTTIPIKDQKLGLIGMVCMNTNVNYFKMLSKKKEILKDFTGTVKKTHGTLNEVFKNSNN
jgi:YheO-like PAS domain